MLLFGNREQKSELTRRSNQRKYFLAPPPTWIKQMWLFQALPADYVECVRALWLLDDLCSWLAAGLPQPEPVVVMVTPVGLPGVLQWRLGRSASPAPGAVLGRPQESRARVRKETESGLRRTTVFPMTAVVVLSSLILHTFSCEWMTLLFNTLSLVQDVFQPIPRLSQPCDIHSKIKATVPFYVASWHFVKRPVSF